VSFEQLVLQVEQESLSSLGAYLPELILATTIVVLLLARIPRWTQAIPSGLIVFLGCTAALSASILEDPYFGSRYAARDHVAPDPVSFAASSEAQAAAAEAATKIPRKELGQDLFSGLLRYDRLTVFYRTLIIGFTLLLIVLTAVTGIPDHETGPDIYSLLLGSVIGMCIMVSANHLLMVFLGVEMASVPSYVLAGTLKGRKRSSEAALKYAVYGAGAAGVMLYGISLLAGALGTAHLPTMAAQLADLMLQPGWGDKQIVLLLGALMVTVGLAFKLSAFPFHFWCPDVFEGATAEVAAFLSIASKAAALALLVRLAISFGGEGLPASTGVALQAETNSAPRVGMMSLAQETAAPSPSDNKHEPAAHSSPQQAVPKQAEPAPTATSQPVPPALLSPFGRLAPIRQFLVFLISLLAAVTATFGNLAAYGQTNIKRLLAYSTIAHAGYMMMPVAAAVQVMDTDPVGAREALGSLGLYLITYLFMNLGAFAIVALLRNVLRSEEISAYAGLGKSCPGITVCMGILMFSLVGLPPLAGFVAKLSIFAALADAHLYTLLVIGGINTFLCLFYYLRVVKVMVLDPEPDNRPPVRLPLFGPGLFVVLMTVPVILIIFAPFWEPLRVWSLAAAANLF